MPIDDRERARRSALLHAHYRAENANDLDAIMKTFGGDGVMHYNHQQFPDQPSIRQAHTYMGFAGTGAFSNLTTTADAEHCTEDEIVVEGRLRGRHIGEFQGFPPSGRDVELPFVAFYRFDVDGKLVSERVVMNLGSLAHTPGVVPG